MNFNIFSSPKYLGIFFDSKLLPTYLPSDEDVSFILGIVPLFVMIFVPIYGFIGDIIGFRFVLTFDVVIMAVSITLFHQVPRFEKHLEKFPFANVTTTSSSSENSDIFAVYWTICDLESEEDMTSLNHCNEFWYKIQGHQTQIGIFQILYQGQGGQKQIFLGATVNCEK